jgi:large subunit ribosomal protein L14
MIQLNSNLNIIDNSGAKIARCIKVLSKSSEASIGDIIVVSIRKATPHRKVNAGEVHKAIIVSTKKNTKRSNGSYVKLSVNAAVLLNEKGLPQATRILRGIPYEFKNKKFNKILSIAKRPI